MRFWLEVAAVEVMAIRTEEAVGAVAILKRS